MTDQKQPDNEDLEAIEEEAPVATEGEAVDFGDEVEGEVTSTFGDNVVLDEGSVVDLLADEEPDVVDEEFDAVEEDEPVVAPEVEAAEAPEPAPFEMRDYLLLDELNQKLARIRQEMKMSTNKEDTNFFVMIAEGGTLHAMTGCDTRVIAQAFAQIIFAENNILIDLVAALLADRETSILLPTVLNTMSEAMNAVSQAQDGTDIIPGAVEDENKH